MSYESKVVRRVAETDGLLTNKAGTTMKVRFSLVERQAYEDGVPMLRSAEGTLEFENRADGWAMVQSPENKTLTGGGIQAEVLLISTDSFGVTGEVKDI